ncbi:Chymotrypsin-like protease CTRL-1 [Trichoplax sp. H2]|nr:Chymotrypsin-like protease CTRL-1 [Trichoplax sp. H2]|eukprot:RDD36395.1 Chymotrypsin-like protease CTRL-1 [Trichoplax sp. H2]
MKTAIIFCALFAVTFAAVRPVPFDLNYYFETVEYNPKVMTAPARRNTDRIIGGENDVKGEHPYQISLQRKNSSQPCLFHHICGGSIINQQHILTAAHCVDSGKVSDFRVVAGEYDLSRNENTEQIIPVIKLIIRSDWNLTTLNNDIAVVKLASKLTYNSYVAPIALASVTPPTNTASQVVGWGLTNYVRKTRPNILQVLDVKRTSDSDAAAITSKYNNFTQVAATTNIFCEGLCKNDSGGPLVFKQNNQYLQYGVASYVALPCGLYPADFYARVSSFKAWIEDNSRI